MMPDSHELAWAAGFFDGEGSTGTSVGARRKQINGRLRYTGLRLTISQVDRQVLDRFRAAVRVGSVTGPYGNGEKRQPAYRFSTNSFENVQAVVAMLWKWLGPIKRQQAKHALVEWRNRPRLKTGRRRNATVYTLEDYLASR